MNRLTTALACCGRHSYPFQWFCDCFVTVALRPLLAAALLNFIRRWLDGCCAEKPGGLCAARAASDVSIRIVSLSA